MLFTELWALARSSQDIGYLILSLENKKHNKRFKRDNQRVAFLLCVSFCGYGVMRKLGSGVGCPLTGRYALIGKMTGVNNESA